jgi:hypothetical protein
MVGNIFQEDQSKQVGQPKKKLPETNGIDHSQSGTSMTEDVMAILQSQNGLHILLKLKVNCQQY